jgi:tRNA threonylcarbamoyladenosine biosynthesis protein TsaE
VQDVTPILSKGILDFVSHSPSQTERIGMRLAQLIRPGDVICLEGELGAGKTVLAKGIGAGLGVREPITSPTFIMVSEHRVPGSTFCFYHIDLYRLSSPQEACGLGLEEYLYGDGVCVVEWPERAAELLPRERLWIIIKYVDENRRNLTMQATGARYEELLSQLTKQAFGVEAP